MLQPTLRRTQVCTRRKNRRPASSRSLCHVSARGERRRTLYTSHAPAVLLLGFQAHPLRELVEVGAPHTRRIAKVRAVTACVPIPSIGSVRAVAIVPSPSWFRQLVERQQPHVWVHTACVIRWLVDERHLLTYLYTCSLTAHPLTHSIAHTLTN